MWSTVYQMEMFILLNYQLFSYFTDDTLENIEYSPYWRVNYYMLYTIPAGCFSMPVLFTE